MAIVGFVLVAVVVGGVYLYLNQVARSLIETEATGAMGVQTTPGSFRLRPLAGRISLGGLEVENPKGFSSPRFLALNQGRAKVELDTLTDDLVEISLMELDGLDVFIERAGGATNYGKVLDSLNRVESEPSVGAEGSGTNFVIRDLYIRNITAHAKLEVRGVSTPDLSVPISEIHLKNVGVEEGGVEEGGVEMRELAATLTGAVLGAVARTRGLLPARLSNELSGRVRQLRATLPLKGLIANFGSAGDSAAKGARECDRQSENRNCVTHLRFPLDRAQARSTSFSNSARYVG
ncbi:MAG: hypothetical protein GY725_20835 [bacterium]|nr:hypothetical protein [bacterium]